MPLQHEDLGKRTLVRSDDGKWLSDGRLIGLEQAKEGTINSSGYVWKKYLAWARVRFSNGSIWRLDVARVRVIDEHPAATQPPCLPGVADADTEAQDH